ncbi:MAG: hypothetical protein JRJ65_20730, partial [Deltaproteobacteria bacterium]|nr:hypothetical protein [Deltaproteobacteria bacterium]
MNKTKTKFLIYWLIPFFISCTSKNTQKRKQHRIKISVHMKIKYLILPICGWILFFIALTLQSSYAQSESSKTENICWWRFNKESEHFVIDEVQQKKDSVFGSFEYVPGIYGNAIKLDGFRTYIKRDQNNLTSLTGAFTVESWIALASYPWFWSPVIDCSYERLKGFFFGIDPEGHVGFKIGAGSSWNEATTEMN